MRIPFEIVSGYVRRMRSDHGKSLLAAAAVIVLFCSLASGCGGSRRPAQRQDPLLSRDSGQQIAGKPVYGPAELQSGVISFATTFISVLSNATREMTELDGSPQARMIAARTRLFATASAADIASGPYPGINLLDLMVFVSLKRVTWQDYWVPKVLGENGRPVLNALILMEEDLWQLAARLLSPEDLAELKRLIIKWHQRHPDLRDTNYVRFSEFGELGLKPSMARLSTPGGIFGAIDKAAEAAKDIALTMDRAMFKLRAMQLNMNAQIEYAYMQLVFQPEVDGVLKETARTTGLMERYADIIDAMPAKMQRASDLTIDRMLAGVAVERNATITQMQESLAQLEQTAVTQVMDRISQERREAIDQAMLGIEAQQRDFMEETALILKENQEELRESLDRAFLLAALLIVIFFGCLTTYRLATRKRGDK